MVIYNNPAGRILAVLQAIGTQNSGPMKQLATALGCREDLDSILCGIVDLRKEIEVLEEQVQGLSENAHKYRLYMKTIEDINRSIGTFSMNAANSVYVLQVVAGTTHALEHIAVELPIEPAVPPSDLEALRKSLDELRRDVEGSEELTKSLKEFLLDLVLAMRAGIDSYTSRGNRGLKTRLHEVIGAILANQEVVKEAEAKAPGIMDRVVDGIGRFSRLAEVGGRFATGIGNLLKAIGHYQG